MSFTFECFLSREIWIGSQIACLLFCVLIIYTLKVQMCYDTFVLICHCDGTCLIRILYPKKVKIVKMPKTASSLFFYLIIYALEVQMCYALLFTSVYNHVELWSLIYCLLWVI